MYYIIFYLAEELFIKVNERWVSSKYRHKLSRYCKYIYIFPSTILARIVSRLVYKGRYGGGRDGCKLLSLSLIGSVSGLEGLILLHKLMLVWLQLGGVNAKCIK